MDNVELFKTEVEKTLQLYEETIGHPGARTRAIIVRYGAVGALSKLMISPDLQKGFKVLRDSNQLERTFEALVIKFKDLFTADIVQAAQWRLSHPHDLL